MLSNRTFIYLKTFSTMSKSLFKSIYVFCFILLCIVPSFANFGDGCTVVEPKKVTKPNWGCGEMPEWTPAPYNTSSTGQYCVDVSDCPNPNVLSIQATISVAYLEFHNVPIDIHFRYNLNNQENGLTNKLENHLFQQVTDEQGLTYYEFTFLLPDVHIAAECPITGAFDFFYFFELVSPDPQTGEFYPIYMSPWNGPGELFDANIIETWDPCAYEGLKHICCDPTMVKTPLIAEPDSDENITHAENELDVEPGIHSLIDNSNELEKEDGFDSELIEQSDHIFNVFPNPFQNEFTLQTDQVYSDIVSLEITDLNGKILESLSFQEEKSGTPLRKSFNTIEWPNGVYIISIQTNEGYQILKIIK